MLLIFVLFFTASISMIHWKLVTQADNKPTYSYSQYIIYYHGPCNKERLQKKNTACDSNYIPLSNIYHSL